MAERTRRDSAAPAVNRRSVVPPPAPAAEPDPAVESTPPAADDPHRGARALAAVKRALSTASALALLALAVVGGRAAHRWMHTTPRFGARDIVVEGLSRTARAEVLRASGLTESTNVLSIDPRAVAREVESLPWVAHATVRRRLPDHVSIAVEERVAAAVVSAGSLYLASPDGTLFKRLGPGDPVDLPVVTGVSRDEFRDDPDGAREQVRDALALVADLSSVQVGRGLSLSEVHREPNGDLSMVVDGTYVWLGAGPYRAKLTRLRVVLAELRRRGLDASEVHLETDRHPERVTVRAEARVAESAQARPRR